MNAQSSKTKNPNCVVKVFSGALVAFCLSINIFGLDFQRDFKLKIGGTVEIVNLYGRVRVETVESDEPKIKFIGRGSAVTEKDFSFKSSDDKFRVEVNQPVGKRRIDILIRVPERAKLKIETEEGEVAIEGNISSAKVVTDTGTIATNVPLDNLKYEFWWTESRPRYVSDVTLEEVREKSAGRFVLSGKYSDAESNAKKEKSKTRANGTNTENRDQKVSEDQKSKTKNQKSNEISLNFSTARGIVLLNVSPSEVSSDLRERPLSTAAKAIVRSGDPLLSEAIRRTSPKFFGDYLKTLPPRRASPTLTERPRDANYSNAKVKRVVARVVDAKNRAIAGLEKRDFVLTEKGIEREILSVEPVSAPFNLVLLLDVSGSIDNYVNFIRKAARNFLNSMRPEDKISILIFNEDVQQIAAFTTDRGKLSESLDTFDAGGGTAYYDAIAYALVDTLKPFKGERTAIVILSDGDDNRSFLSFESLIGSIQESGALIYPLYVPTSLAAASAANNPENTTDPLRTRYMGLTSKAEGEGARLAQVSGGVYYPIRRLDDLQKAYEDIVVQLRTAYNITYRSDTTEAGDSASPRLRVKVNREGAFVNLGAVTPVSRNIVTGAHSLAFLPFSFNLQQPQEITGEVGDIKYKPLLGNTLKTIPEENFDINVSPPAFLFGELAVSRWVSPKRTRSYPYERIYNTLSHQKRVTIIPIIKDEGKSGERDFLQFDTVSLMNLLDIYVVLGNYVDAQRDASDELTSQSFDNGFILNKLNDLRQFDGTAAAWNLRELQGIPMIAEKAKTAYREISKRLNVALHDEKGIDNFTVKISKSLDQFRELSRQKSKQAQGREFITTQPREALSSETKARVTITDKSGGVYFFTCDETKFDGKTLTLIEAKHSSRAKMPSPSDVKDGLLKMMLYTSLKNVKVGNHKVALKVAIRLTSDKLRGSVSSSAEETKLDDFLQDNVFSKTQSGFVRKLFQEARQNNFEIILERGVTSEQ